MPDFTVVILTSEGMRERRRVAGRDADDACARLRAGGVFVERITLAGPARRFLARARISPTHLVEFFHQMETLLASGVLIADALSRLKDRYPDRRTRRILAEVHAQVAESRTTLSKALSLFPRSFPPGIIAVIEAGEEGGAGMLAERFADLAERIAYEDSNRKQVFKACAYPVFVFVMALGVYALLLGIVFPRLTELLISLGGQLPPLTRRVIAVSSFVKRWLPVLAVLLVAIPLLTAGLRKFSSPGLLLDRLFLRLPLVGAIYRDLTVALICKIFCSLYKTNKSAPEIIGLCSRLVGNRAFRHGLQEMRDQMTTGGATVTNAFAHSGLFPPLACMAIDVGEQSGRIPEAMERVAAYFNARARERIGASIAVINPLMTIAVVGCAGVIMISFFQAVYQIVYVAH